LRLLLDAVVSMAADLSLDGVLARIVEIARLRRGLRTFATRVEIRVSAGDSLDLVVCDNGGGIPDEAQESGLRNIRDRAMELGGACEVESSPDGTTITWAVPLS
jgi:signal transduction histidine kinase